MPLYDYKCLECDEYFEQMNSIANRAEGTCPHCEGSGKQVLRSAPPLMIEAMADAGFPGAFHTSGDRLEKKHRSAGQYHTASKKQSKDADARHADFVRSVSEANKAS